MATLKRVVRPSGITVDVAIPRWLLQLLRMSIALWLIGVLVLILVGFALIAVRDIGSSSGLVWQSPGMSLVRGDFTARPIQYQVQLTAGSEPAEDLDREWTLLLSSGSTHWANVVDGPKRLEPGETGTFTLTFQFEPQAVYGEPVAIRWDPERKVNSSLSMR